ncbi:MAG: LamG-like jellyroll fold domain-containing protein [Candidatus Paceibacterota bacterium]|jgi:prepilin-type N-terminal cleavage/methylation domain-containing protein
MKQKAFTLIELLVVIAIVGILSSVIYSNITGIRDRARIMAGIRFDSSMLHSIGDQLVGELLFDTNANPTPDTSGSGNNGTVYGATYATTSGYNDKGAYSFDGTNDYINVANSASLNFDTGDFTIATWIKTSTLADFRNLIYKGAGDGYSGWRFGLDNGVPHILIGDTTGFVSRTFGSVSIANGIWHYLAIAYDRDSVVSAYVDGVLVGTVNIYTKTGSVNNSASLIIGLSYARYNGLLDNIRFYSSALSASDIQNLYAEGVVLHPNLANK